MNKMLIFENIFICLGFAFVILLFFAIGYLLNISNDNIKCLCEVCKCG